MNTLLAFGLSVAATVVHPVESQTAASAMRSVSIQQVESYYCYRNAAAAIRNNSSMKIVATVTVTVPPGLPPAPPTTVTLAPSETYTLGCLTDDSGRGSAVFSVSAARFVE